MIILYYNYHRPSIFPTIIFENLPFLHSRMRFEKFEMPKHGYDQVDGSGMATGAGDGTKGYGADDGGGDSPMSFEEIERPPLRHIDKYVRAECPCIKTTRFTIALMTCLGFIISFGMRCNMGMAKLQFENAVS